MVKKVFSEDQWYHTEKLVFGLLRVVVALGLLIGGIILLGFRIAGWGIILGLPMVIFGSVFIIYTYDEVLSKQVKYHSSDKEDKNRDEDSE